MATSIVVVYHFVRNMHETPYPGIKGRLVDDFVGQVEYLCRHHEALTMRDLILYLDGERSLPQNGFYLTFDDGFRDHYDTVLPVLKSHNLEAAFFPMTEPLVHARVPSMEKLRFLMRTLDFHVFTDEFRDTVDRLFPQFDTSRLMFQGEQADEARSFNSFDELEVSHFKRFTTVEMPREIRNAVLDYMFPRYFGTDAEFIKELYMNWDELTALQAEGMVVGAHTVTHPWLPVLSQDEQATEINDSFDALQEKLDDRVEVFSYPYGGYDESTLAVLSRRNSCRLALTDREGVGCHRAKPLEVERLDTTHLPLSAAAAPNAWSLRVISDSIPHDTGDPA